MKSIVNSYQANDMALIYIRDTDSGVIGFTIVPWSLKDAYTLKGQWKTESCIQVKSIYDDGPVGFSCGHTMRNSETSFNLKYIDQICTEEDGIHRIETVIESQSLRGHHLVTYREGGESITVWAEVENIGQKPDKLEMVSSFSLCSIFGFTEEERTGDFRMHRLRSRWSEEGRLETRSFLEMQLEPSWQKYGTQSIRYGQVGSMPVRRFFPWFAVEDERNNCLIGGTLALPSSWQMEIFSEDDRPAVSGGIADREFGHWMKTLQPGERFVTPKAELSCCQGKLDDLCGRITNRQREGLDFVPEVEKELPVIFNEFCTTWGQPSQEKLEALVSRLEGEAITYCVIDAGWYADPVKGWESNMGDWVPCKTLFPDGLEKAADTIKSHGMIPGIWFEVETAGKESDIYHNEAMLLTRDEIPVTTGRRRFLDMRKDCVRQYLAERVTGCLKDNGFGYLKVDYNDTIGIGCDGEDSLGENLRVHMACSQEFYQNLRKEIPELVMENCSSGGHRLEPSMMELFSMASFSDAHECISEPIVAANLHRAIQPAKIQIWAVLRPEADEKRMRYVLAATFLGRMCLSGDVDHLSEYQWEIVRESIAFYRRCALVIRDGRSYRYGGEVCSYAHPEGYQILVRKTEEEAVIVLHIFERVENIREEIKELEGFSISDFLGRKEAKISLGSGGVLSVGAGEALEGFVLVAKKQSKARKEIRSERLEHVDQTHRPVSG